MSQPSSSPEPISTTSESELVERIGSPPRFARAASGGRWKMAPHLLYLDAMLTEAISYPPHRLLISEPPRHGKSELCSKFLPAWFLGTFPDKRVILCSYEADFAES